ncbi:MAG TPA: hypothetical protein PLE43_06550 [Alphaproteobacteria bacterium]|jgi:hypothetical protein|nr:hypothetical protein [Alphaproteobacteria bacterium]
MIREMIAGHDTSLTEAFSNAGCVARVVLKKVYARIVRAINGDSQDVGNAVDMTALEDAMSGMNFDKN